MGYKLADGSDSDLYKEGDAFIATNSAGHVNRGAIMHFSSKTKVGDDFTHFLFNGMDDYNWDWASLTPTEETKRKVAERYFPHIKSDYPEWLLSAVKERINKAATTIFRQKAKEIAGPEPLARIIDWRGGEPHNPTDIIVNADGDTATLFRMVHMIGKDGWNTIIRINTGAIPKQRTMTKAEVEREFGVKISD